MSYGFKVSPDEQGVLQISEVSGDVPAGVFSIQGHHVDGRPGWSPVEVLGVNLVIGDKYVISAQGTAQRGGSE